MGFRGVGDEIVVDFLVCGLVLGFSFLLICLFWSFIFRGGKGEWEITGRGVFGLGREELKFVKVVEERVNFFVIFNFL